MKPKQHYWTVKIATMAGFLAAVLLSYLLANTLELSIQIEAGAAIAGGVAAILLSHYVLDPLLLKRVRCPQCQGPTAHSGQKQHDGALVTYACTRCEWSEAFFLRRNDDHH